MRSLILFACVIPYAWFGLRDNLYHLRHRNVTLLERLLHATIVISALTLVPHAMAGNANTTLAGLLLFVTARTLDEFIFHRGVPGEEADVHAKTHFAFLLFVVAIMTVDWLDSNQWRLPGVAGL
jgi:hypothetical protein